MPYDSCATALEVTLSVGTPYTQNFDTTGNASDPTITADCLANNAGANALWLKVISPIDSAIIVDTHGSDYDTEVVAFSGACGSLVELDCGEDDEIEQPPNNDGFQSTVDAIPVQAGVPVYIGIADFDEVGGDLVVNIQLADPSVSRYVLSEDGWRGEQIAYSAEDGTRVAQGGLRNYGETPDESGGFDPDTPYTASLDGTRLYKSHNDDDGFHIQAYDRFMQPVDANVLVSSSGLVSIVCSPSGTVYTRALIGGVNRIAAYTSELSAVDQWPAGSGSVFDDVDYFAVSPDDTILYYRKQGAGNVGKLFRYNLSTDTDLGHWLTTPTTATGPDFILYLHTAANGDIILVAAENDDPAIEPDEFLIHRYSSSGTLQSTADMPQGTSATALNPDGLSLWYIGADTTVKHILIADGTILDAFPIDADASPGGWLAIMAEAAVDDCPDQCEDAGVGEPYWALAPEYNRTYFYDRLFTLYSTVSTIGAVAIAPDGQGRVWIALDDNPNSTTILYLVDPFTIDENTAEATIERVIEEVHNEDGEPIQIGELGGRHALFVADCNQLVTVDRGTHDVIKICIPAEGAAEQVAIVGRRYALNINPLDAQLVDNGENLLYAEGASMKVYSLLNDAAVRTLYTGSSSLAWPTVLTDNSFLVREYSSTPFRTNGDVIRVSRTGSLIRRFTYDSGLFSAGQYNIGGDIETDICACGDATHGLVVIPGEADPAVVMLNLHDGTVPFTTEVGNFPGNNLPDVTQGGVDTAAAFCQIYGAATGSSFSDQTGGLVDSQLSGRNRRTPNRHCGPEAGVSSPAPNPGCNAGGRGWTPSYLGASGSVPSATDPTNEETLTGERTAFIRVKVRHTDYGGSSPGEEVLCLAKVDLPSNPDDLFLHPHAEARVLSIGDDDRGLSDGQGNMKSGSTNIQFMDSVGRPFGVRLVSESNRFFTRDELVLEAVTPDGLRSGATPRRIGTGLVYGETYGSTVFGLTAVDPLFIEGGSSGPDKRIPLWSYPLDFYTTAPPDLANVVMPFYYGEKSDEGAVSLTTNAENSRGLCTVRYVGTETIDGETWGRFNVCLFAIYDILALYGSDLGGLGIYGDGATVEVIEPSDNPDSEITTETTVVTLDGSPDLSGVAADGSMQIVIFASVGRTEAPIVGVDSAAGTVTIETAIDSELADGVPWYISSIDYVPRRVQIDLDTRNGVDVQVPHWDNFFRATPYEDISTEQGIMRVTDLWIKGALLSASLVGEVTPAVNLIGIEDKGDGSGLPITEYFTAFNHFVDNFIHIQRPIPNGAGSLWPQNAAQLPEFSDGVSKTKSSSFEAAQALTVLDLGGNGLQINAGFTEPISVRDALQLWIINGACKAGIDEYGRFYVWLLDREQDTSAWPHLTHVSRAFGESPTRTRALDEACNWYRGGCDFDPEGGFYREDNLTSISNESVTHNKGVARQSKHYDLKLLGHTNHAQWVLDQNLLINRDGPNYVVIPGMDWGVLDYPIGSGIRFSSPMLPGADANGMVSQPMVILDRHFDLDSGLATITCLDFEIVGLAGSPQ